MQPECSGTAANGRPGQRLQGVAIATENTAEDLA